MGKRKKVRSRFVQFVIRADIFDKLDKEKDGYKSPSVSMLVKEYLVEMDRSDITLEDIRKLDFTKKQGGKK